MLPVFHHDRGGLSNQLFVLGTPGAPAARKGKHPQLVGLVGTIAPLDELQFLKSIEGGTDVILADSDGLGHVRNGLDTDAAVAASPGDSHEDPEVPGVLLVNEADLIQFPGNDEVNLFFLFLVGGVREHLQCIADFFKKEANEVAVSWEKAVRKEKKSKVECQSEMADIIARAGREATVGRLTLDKARRYLMEIYRLASGEEFPSYSVSEWLTHWLDESEKRVGEATMRRYHTSVRDVLKVLGSSGEKDIALLTTEDVLRVRDFLRKSGGKASTINYKVQDFKSAIKAAFERGIIDRNVGLSVDALTTEDSDIKAGFSSEEVQQLIEAANHDWKGAILIAAQTGLRLTNIAELKWSEVDLEKRQFVLTPVKQKRGKSVVITIPMSRAVIEFFRGTEEKKSGPVFPRLSERQTSTLSTTFSNLMKKAEVPKETQLPGGKVGKRSFHSLRHYCTASA